MQDAAADPALAPQLGGEEPTLLFCGDLNSDLNDGIPGAATALHCLSFLPRLNLKCTVRLTARDTGTGQQHRVLRCGACGFIE